MWIPSVSPPLFASRQPRGNTTIAPVLATDAEPIAPTSERDSRPTSTSLSDHFVPASRPPPFVTRPTLPNGGGGSPATAAAPADGLDPGLQQFMAAQSPGIEMDSDRAGAGAGAVAGDGAY